MSEQFRDEDASITPPPPPPPLDDEDLSSELVSSSLLHSPSELPPPLNALPENKRSRSSSSPPTSPPPKVPTDENEEEKKHHKPPPIPPTHRHKPPPIPSPHRHIPPPVPSAHHHKKTPPRPPIQKDLSFGPPHDGSGIEKSISFGPPHDGSGIEKSISFGPPHDGSGIEKSISFGPPHKNVVKPPPVPHRGTPKHHINQHKVETSTKTEDLKNEEEIPPPPPPTISTEETVKKDDKIVEDEDYELLPDGLPPKITSNSVMQSFDYGIPPTKPSVWDTLDNIVDSNNQGESNGHDSTTTEEDDDEEEVSSIARRPSLTLNKPKRFVKSPFLRRKSNASIEPPPTELLSQEKRSSPYSTRKGSSYESRRRNSSTKSESSSSTSNLTSSPTKVMTTSTIQQQQQEKEKEVKEDEKKTSIDLTVFRTEIEEERTRAEKIKEEYENHEIMMAEKEKEFQDKLRLSTLERDEIVYRMECAQEDNKSSIRGEETAFRKELASQHKLFESEIEKRDLEIRRKDGEIQEKRQVIKQEDAESALRVEMTEMRIKDLAERAQKMVTDAKNRSERSEMTWKWELTEMERKHNGVVSRLEHLVLSTRQKMTSEMLNSTETIKTQTNQIEHLQRMLHAAETEMDAKLKMLKWESVNRTESMERAIRAQSHAEISENRRILEEKFSIQTSEAMSEIRKRLNEARILSHEWRNKTARATMNHSHALAELQQHERELAISRSECELLRSRLQEAEEEVSFGQHDRQHLLSILSQSIPPGLTLGKNNENEEEVYPHHHSDDEDGYETVDEEDKLLGEGSELMENMELNLKKAENSLRRLSLKVGIEDDDDNDDDDNRDGGDEKKEPEDIKTPHKPTFDDFRKFCGSMVRRSRRKRKKRLNTSSNSSVLKSMIASTIPSVSSSVKSSQNQSSFLPDHTVLRSLVKSHLRKSGHVRHVRPRDGAIRIARTLLLCSSESTMLPVVQRRVCDALWDHSRVVSNNDNVRVLTFESLWMAASRCLVYGRATKNALQEQFNVIQNSNGYVEYKELIHAIQWNATRI